MSCKHRTRAIVWRKTCHKKSCLGYYIKTVSTPWTAKIKVPNLENSKYVPPKFLHIFIILEIDVIPRIFTCIKMVVGGLYVLSRDLFSWNSSQKFIVYKDFKIQ